MTTHPLTLAGRIAHAEQVDATLDSGVMAYCGGHICREGLEGRCAGHPVPQRADHEYRPDLVPIDPKSFDLWTTDQFDAAGGFFLTAWRSHMLRLQEERDRFFALWRDAEERLAEGGCRGAAGPPVTR
jgi:hypothetical protein